MKVTKFNITPQPKTNNNDGFQFTYKAKKSNIFDLRTIPAINNPLPNISPTIKVINWSIAILETYYLFSGSLNTKYPPIIGNKAPKAIQILADI